VSSIVAGTPGFISPEALLNRPLSLSSDLYSLGATLICLLTGTSSSEIADLVNSSFEIEFQHLVTGVEDYSLVHWLSKMVAPDPHRRFDCAQNAADELETLKEEIVDHSADDWAEWSLLKNEWAEMSLRKKIFDTIAAAIVVGGIGLGIVHLLSISQPLFLGNAEDYLANFVPVDVKPAISLSFGLLRLIFSLLVLLGGFSIFSAYQLQEEIPSFAQLTLVLVISAIGTDMFIGLLLF
jgi:serine/threonine protein kinase